MDLFCSERDEPKFKFSELNIDYIILGLYMILTLLLIYVYDKPIYPFLKNIHIFTLLCYGIIFIIVMFISYYLYLGLLILKYKYNIGLENENENEINNLNDELFIDNKED